MSSALSTVLRTAVDDAVDAAFAADFVQDPLLGPEASRLISVTNSIVKRHGPLIEAGIACALTETGRFEVMRNLRFPITKTADRLVASNAPGELMRFQLKFDGDWDRGVDLDLVAIDTKRDILFAADVKRGNGSTEQRKRAPIEANLDAVRLLGRSYSRQHGFPVDEVRVAIIDYHGLSQFSERLRVPREALDAFFGAPVVATVEAMTNYLRGVFRKRMPELMRSMIDAETVGAVENDFDAMNAEDVVGRRPDNDDTPISPIRLPLGVPRKSRRDPSAA